MIPDTTTTWQKVTIILAVLTLAVPNIAKFGWQILFPPNYLLLETTHTTTIDDRQIAAAVVVNAGSEIQKDVILYLPSDAADSSVTRVEVSTPRRSNLRPLFEAEPITPLAKYSHESGYKLPLGNIAPDQEVRVTIASLPGADGGRADLLQLREARVESSSTSAIEADGIRYPDFAQDRHSIYVEAAPYFLAMLLALLAVLIVVGVIHDVFFDSSQKQMTRLWRQMDALQEKIDKERHYQ